MIPVHTLWTHGPLTPLALTCLASYERHGCKPVVWSYFGENFPPGLDVRDARDACPESEIERFRFHNGQLALFSDRFAWGVIEKCGGWWGHLDVTLLRPLPMAGDYLFFGPHHRCSMVTSLWKAPQGAPFLRALLARHLDLPAKHWYVTMDAMAEALRDHNLLCHVAGGLINNDHEEEPLWAMLRAGSELHPEWRGYVAIHWMASGAFRGREPEPGSFFSELMP